MFVQISPSETDAPETLCSLSFASRVRGVELGPPKKQSANQGGGEVMKYKQMVRLLYGRPLMNRHLAPSSEKRGGGRADQSSPALLACRR